MRKTKIMSLWEKAEKEQSVKARREAGVFAKLGGNPRRKENEGTKTDSGPGRVRLQEPEERLHPLVVFGTKKDGA